MAIVDKIRPETIEKLRGRIDFYMLRGILPVARRWPKKPKPPYTALQAEAMAVFSIACANMKRISDNILEKWREGSEGKRSQWTDVFKGIIMKYWKLNKSIAPIAIDYQVTETDTQFKVLWNILQVYISPNKKEEIYNMETNLIDKKDIGLMPKPIYFTLFDDEGIRLVAPYILFELTP